MLVNNNNNKNYHDLESLNIDHVCINNGANAKLPE